MSYDCGVHVKDLSKFSWKACENYFRSLGIEAEIHPDVDIFSHTGFLPIKINGGGFIAAKIKNKAFLSGFEVSLNEYNPEDYKDCEQDDPFIIAIKDSKYEFFINCGWQDSFEILLSYLFASYLCNSCGGVLYNPQEGQFYDKVPVINSEISAMIDYLKELYQKNELLTHEFEKWL